MNADDVMLDDLERELRQLTRRDESGTELWKAALEGQETASRDRARRFFAMGSPWRLTAAAMLTIACGLLITFTLRGPVAMTSASKPPDPMRQMPSSNASYGADWADRQFTNVPDDDGLVNESMHGAYVNGMGGGGSLPGKRAPGPPSAAPRESSPDATQRAVVRRALIEVVAADVQSAFFKATSFIHEEDGEYVGESQLLGSGDDARSTLTLRVRSNRVVAVLGLLRDLGDVANEQVSADDVSAQVVDLESRLRNERRIETEILALLDSIKDPTLKDVLAMRVELTQVRERIERLVGEQQRLNRFVELATISVIIRSKAKPIEEPPPPKVQSSMEQFTASMSRAWSDGVRSLGDAIAFLVSIAVGGLPWWIALSIVTIALRRAWQRRIEAGLAERSLAYAAAMRMVVASIVGALLLHACAAPTPPTVECKVPTEEEKAAIDVPPPPPVIAPQPIIALRGGIEVDRSAGEVRIPAHVATTVGWLEQVACMVDTREHESLLVVDVKPSDVHAALLALGLEPGAPGRWNYDGKNISVTPPRGDDLIPMVRWRDGEALRERPLVEWIHGADGRAFPSRWVFAGSRFAKNPPSLGPGEHYEADFSGSLVGLVSFGDETIAAVAVFADQEAIEAVNWEAWTERMPSEGTAATLVLKKASP